MSCRNKGIAEFKTITSSVLLCTWRIQEIIGSNGLFIQVINSINKTNLFRGGNHSSVVFAGSRDIEITKLYK